MNNFSLKNRIAFYYIISAAMLIFVVFLSIYNIVSFAVNNNVNEHINNEVKEYKAKINIESDEIELRDNEEWEQREHNEVSVDPVFLQITDNFGTILEKSDNLKNQSLEFNYKLFKEKVTDLKLSGKLIRKIQVPLFYQNKIKGYLLVAVSMEEATLILEKLQRTLYIIFPIVLLLLFFVAQFIAGRSIKPINSIISTSDAITKDNLKLRIALPKNKDELFLLSQTINNLLDRIESTIEREKQFTSDASHELRTPLAVIKGTLEVLIRKPRNTDEYQQKINFCISEVDRINNLVDQLLLLARFENQKLSLDIKYQNLNQIVNECINQLTNKAKKNNVTILEDYHKSLFVDVDKHLILIVLNNLISNAIKYSKENGKITISMDVIDSKTILKIADNGIGINNNEIGKVFDAFYRTHYTNNHPEIKGIGLGLSIAKRLCDVLDVKIEISSKESIGTILTLVFP